MLNKDETLTLRVIQETTSPRGRKTKRWLKAEMSQLEPGDVIRFYSRDNKLVEFPTGKEFIVTEAPSIKCEPNDLVPKAMDMRAR